MPYMILGNFETMELQISLFQPSLQGMVCWFYMFIRKFSCGWLLRFSVLSTQSSMPIIASSWALFTNCQMSDDWHWTIAQLKLKLDEWCLYWQWAQLWAQLFAMHLTSIIYVLYPSLITCAKEHPQSKGLFIRHEWRLLCLIIVVHMFSHWCCMFILNKQCLANH